MSLSVLPKKGDIVEVTSSDGEYLIRMEVIDTKGTTHLLMRVDNLKKIVHTRSQSPEDIADDIPF